MAKAYIVFFCLIGLAWFLGTSLGNPGDTSIMIKGIIALWVMGWLVIWSLRGMRWLFVGSSKPNSQTVPAIRQEDQLDLEYQAAQKALKERYDELRRTRSAPPPSPRVDPSAAKENTWRHWGLFLGIIATLLGILALVLTTVGH